MPDAGTEDRELQREASAFLQLLAGTLAQAQLYEPDNRILSEPVIRLLGQLRRLFAHGPSFMFQGRDGSVFINDVRLRCDGATFSRHQDFLKQLEPRKVSGLSFASELTAEQWRAALFILARCDRRDPAVFQRMQEALEKNGLAGLLTLLPLVSRVVDGGASAGATKAAAAVGGAPGPSSDAGAALKAEVGPKAVARRVKMDRRLFAGRAYVKAMLTLRDYVDSLGDPARGNYHHLWLQRAVFDVVTMCEEHGWRHIGLVNNKGFDDYLFNHSVNVTVLSLILGLRVGMGRPRLAELALAAMVHHLGKARLPKELLE
jgi:hypothetical protein